MYRGGSEALLSRAAETLDRVVDPALRQRLMGQYLTLLQRYQRGRGGRNFSGEVRALWNQIAAGTVQYKLWPGLGTIHGHFYDNRDSALAVLERLGEIAGRQRDLDVRRRWLAEIADLKGMLDMLSREAQMASTNVHLSRLESLAIEASNITARHLVPRMVEWSRAVGMPVPPVDPGGQSAAVSIAARPDLWEATGLGEDTYEFFKAVGEGAFSQAADTALVEAQKKYGDFLKLIKRAGEVLAVQKKHEAALTALASRGDPRLEQLQADVGENRRGVDSAVAAIKNLAAEMRRMPAASWDAPGEAAGALGAGALTADQGATMLLYAPQVEQISQGLEAVAKRIDALSPSLKVAGELTYGAMTGAFVLGLGALALIALRSKR